jgi:hypothetical protein
MYNDRIVISHSIQIQGNNYSLINNIKSFREAYHVVFETLEGVVAALDDALLALEIDLL